MADALAERVDDRIDFRYDSRSQWVREAVQYRMALEDELARQGLELPADDDDRDRALRQIALAGVDAYDGELLTPEELDELREGADDADG